MRSFWARMKQKTSQTLFNYWNEVRNQRLAPRRFEIEPSQIASILPSTFILERIDSATFRFRLAGTAICDAMGQDFRDTNFLVGWDEDDRISLQRLFSVVTQQGGVGVLELEVAALDDQTFAGRIDRPAPKSLCFEVVLLPLIHTHDVIDRVLGSMTPLSTPDWLGHIALSHRKLTTSTVLWPNGKPQSIIETLHRQVPFLPHVRKARIVRSDRRQFRVYDGGLSNQSDD
jgi:hypothetical protein